MKNTGLELCFYNKDMISEIEYLLHPKFKHLSDVHKSDYLRVYFMHNFGGGYGDIKFYKNSWLSALYKLDKSNKYILGYTEVREDAVALVGGYLEIELKKNYLSLIGNGAYICKQGTEFTKEWLDRTNKVLDDKEFDKEYPLKWTELLGNVFHPLCLEFKDFILHDNSVKPVF